jgi:hypothetical protein
MYSPFWVVSPRNKEVAMRRISLSIALACATLLALVSFNSPAQGQSIGTPACQTFKETGKTVCGRFLQYWIDHGGVQQQGYPISGQFPEVSDVNGQTYTVQYFERAEFELHPENKAPFDVLLSLLGSMALKQKYPNGAPGPPTANIPPNAVYFPQTGQQLGSPFLEYWKSHGGLAQQGYPISGQFSERSDLNGQFYTVQYFERAVMEFHPELDQLNNILLSQLGTIRFKQKYPNGEPGGGSGTAIKTGQWGATGIAMIVTATGATIEFDCARARIDQPVTVDANGQFNVTGIFVQEHGGPVYVGDDQGRPARFTGSTDGSVLNLTITYTDDNTKVGSWSVKYGTQGRIVKCM